MQRQSSEMHKKWSTSQMFLLYRWLHMAWHVFCGHFSPNDWKAAAQTTIHAKTTSKLCKTCIHWLNTKHDPSLRHLCYQEGLIQLDVCFGGGFLPQDVRKECKNNNNWPQSAVKQIVPFNNWKFIKMINHSSVRPLNSHCNITSDVFFLSVTSPVTSKSRTITRHVEHEGIPIGIFRWNLILEMPEYIPKGS